MNKAAILRTAKEWLLSFLHAGVVLVVLFLFCWPYRVDGTSMEPYLMPNDRVTISRVWRAIDRPKADDVVVGWLPDERLHVIKRVAATPGQHVVIRDGTVYVNDTPLAQPYLDGLPTTGEVDTVLADDEYFLLGDNRDVSLDSRTFGAVQSKNIIGRVLFRWYPFGSIGMKTGRS